MRSRWNCNGRAAPAAQIATGATQTGADVSRQPKDSPIEVRPFCAVVMRHSVTSPCAGRSVALANALDQSSASIRGWSAVRSLHTLPRRSAALHRSDGSAAPCVYPSRLLLCARPPIARPTAAPCADSIRTPPAQDHHRPYAGRSRRIQGIRPRARAVRAGPRPRQHRRARKPAFPEICATLGGLVDVVFDAERVVPAAEGRSDFGELRRRNLLQRPGMIAEVSVRRPAVLVVFDVLARRAKICASGR